MTGKKVINVHGKKKNKAHILVKPIRSYVQNIREQNNKKTRLKQWRLGMLKIVKQNIYVFNEQSINRIIELLHSYYII